MSGLRLPHTGTEGSRAVRVAGGWLVAALVLALAAATVDRRTEIAIFSDGGEVELVAAGSKLVAPVAMTFLKAVEIRTADSIDPPGGLGVTIADDRGSVLDEDLPRRFDLPRALVPIGDWELDACAASGAVWRRELEVSGPFDVRAVFRGRFLDDLEIVLEGRPGARIAVRRGLINNDLFIRDEAGNDLAATSLDPTPLADLGAIAAIGARGASLAALLIAAFTLLASRAGIRPVPAAASRRRFGLLAGALAVAAAALSGWVAIEVLEGLPHTPDSVVYLLQARWLLEGRLWGELSALQPFLTVPYTYVEGGRWLAHYPPGWPALLAVGVAAGVPALVAPILGAVFVWLLYLTGRELDGPPVGLLAAALGLISPLARVFSGTMLSHTAAATLVLAAILLAMRGCRDGGGFWATGSGLAIGLAFGIRPVTAIAASAPLAMALLTGAFDRRIGRFGRRPLPGFLGGALVAAVPAMIANRLVTGSATVFPYALARGSMFGVDALPFGLRNLDALLASDGAGLYGWGWDLAHGPWVIASAFALAWVPFLLRRARGADVVLAAIALCVMAAHLGTRGHGLHGFGPRYHFEVFAPLFLLTARGFHELARVGIGDRRTEKPMVSLAAIGLFFALSLPAAAILPQRLALYRGYNGVDGSLEQQIAEARLERAVIVLPPDEWQGWAMAVRRITTRPDAPMLILQSELTDPRIFEVAAGRPVYSWQDSALVRLVRPLPDGDDGVPR